MRQLQVQQREGKRGEIKIPSKKALKRGTTGECGCEKAGESRSHPVFVVRGAKTRKSWGKSVPFKGS